MDYLVLFLAVLLPVPMVDVARGRLTPGVMEAVSGFTGAFVLGVIVFHMLPEAYGGTHSAAWVGGCVLAGLLLQTVWSFSPGASTTGIRTPEARAMGKTVRMQRTGR